MLHVLVIIAFVGPNWWMMFTVVGCALTYFKPLSWLGHCSGHEYTFPTEEGTLLNSQHQYKRVMLHGHHRTLMSCVQLSFAKESLSFLENKGLLLSWNPFRRWWIGSGGFMLSKNRLNLFWKCGLQNSSEIRSYGLGTSLFYVNSYPSENGISVHLLLN